MMAAMASHWLKNCKSLKIFFRTSEWNETKFDPNSPSNITSIQTKDTGQQVMGTAQIIGSGD
jgi:hypothetical protein